MAGGPKQVLFYICSCGCKVPDGQLKKYRDRRSGGDKTRMVCPEHYLDEAYIVKYVLKCIDCGKEFEEETRKERCPACHTKNHKKVLKRNQKTYNATHKGKKAAKKATKKYKAKQPKPESLEDQSRIFCANRSRCLDGYKRKPLAQYLPCKGCKDYCLESGENDPLYSRRSA